MSKLTPTPTKCLEVSDHQTEDVKSDRPFSNLKVEVSEATNMRVVSFAQDIIYDVTRGKVKILKRVGLGKRIQHKGNLTHQRGGRLECPN
jgi:hypothetical protein